jgi:hypothetical protein
MSFVSHAIGGVSRKLLRKSELIDMTFQVVTIPLDYNGKSLGQSEPLLGN